MPRTAVDEWGYIGEGRASERNRASAHRFAAMVALDLFAKSLTKYRQAVGSFMRQAKNVLEKY